MRKITILTALLMAMSPFAAMADQISYTYSGNWNTYKSGIFQWGYDATVVFENGGDTIEDQVFSADDFVSATIVSGDYSFTMFASDITGWYEDFVSDALGRLGEGWFNAESDGHTWHFDTWYQDLWANSGNQGMAHYGDTNLSAVGKVPEPGTLALLGLGLAGLGFAKRRKIS